MVVLYIFLTLVVLWVDLTLTSGGIHSVVTVLLMVVLYNLHQVKQMLREIKKPEEKEKNPVLTEPKLPWKCVTCGTENEGTVPCCTNCQTHREWSKMKEQQENEESL